MPREITVRIRAKQYEDHDDCLAAAAADYASDHGLEGWNLEPRWEDDDRDTIVLTVPVTPGQYLVTYSDGRRQIFPSYAAALGALYDEYPDATHGHDGDLQSGGDRTLVWAREEDSVDDDGARAVASIYRGSDQ